MAVDVVVGLGTTEAGGVAIMQLRAVSEDDVTFGERLGGAARPVRSFGIGRVCKNPACKTWLSRYNPGEYCSVHSSLDDLRMARRWSA